MKIAFFGGTFDPVHNGHIAIARAVLANGAADTVLLAPAPSPPHKEHRGITPFGIRLEMVRLAAEGIPGLEASGIEKDRPGKSFTIDTLFRLRELHPHDAILLLIGEDSLRQLHTWKDAHVLAANFEIVSYPRPGESSAPGSFAEHWSASEAAELMRSRLAGVPLFPVSSTEIRAMFARGESARASAFLPPAVFRRIMERRLYRADLKNDAETERTPGAACES